MDEKRKRVTAPRIAAALSALLAGAALYTVSGSERQGIQVKEYAEAAEAADSTIMVYMNGSDLEGDYGAATADLWEMMDALKVMEQEGKSPSLHVVVEAGGSTRWELDEMDGVPYARFSLTEDGKEKAKEDMQKMLDYVDKLDELDTSSVEPMSHIFEDENVFREDVVTNGDNHEAMLANAPKQKENQYQVPKTIG